MRVPIAQRQAIVAALNDGLERQDTVERIGVTPGQVAAVKAPITMRTYSDIGGAADAEAEVANAVRHGPVPGFESRRERK